MTQKDFIFLAGTILNLDCVDDATRQNIAEQFASRLRQTNPRFKSDLFV